MAPDDALPHSVTTPHLLLRPPVADDEGAWVRWHTDPRLYGHAPHARLSPDTARSFLAEVGRHWRTHGFGYWTAVSRETGEPVGMAGLRVEDADTLNLGYRFDAAVHGRGYGREAARAAAAHATEWLSERVVRAVIRPGHVPSIRTAEAAGLVDVGTVRHHEDPPDEPPSRRLEAPRLVRRSAFTSSEREQVLDLWCRVTEAGGAVGFVPGAPRADVDAALGEHEGQMARGDAVAGLLVLPRGEVVGVAWWVRPGNPLLHHTRTVYRVMTDPDRRGRNLGTLLMAGMHRIAREDGAELLVLDYRSGTGVSRFYDALGYREVGRVPRAIRVAPGDERDDVYMARRVDGGPLVPDGRG